MTTQSNRPGRFYAWFLLCGFLVLAALFLQKRFENSLSAQDHSVIAESPGLSIRGTPAAPFELVDIDGRSVTLVDLADKVVLVNFFGTTCAPCVTEIPWLVEFQKQYGPEGLQVVAISMYGETPEELAPYVAKHGMKDFKVVVGTGQIADLFGGVFAFPTTFIVDRYGRYYSRHEGLINRAEVENDLVALLNREDIPLSAEHFRQR